MVELYGLPSSGKSLIAQLIIANAQKAGGDCVYVDAEGAFDPAFAKLLGVNVENLALVQTGIGEDIIDVVIKTLNAEPAVVVIDSVGAIITRDEYEESVEKVFMAPKARLLSKGLPKLTAKNKKTLIIFINQLRKVLTMFGSGGMTTTGGMALGFYSSIRVEVKRDKELLYKDEKKSGEVVGQIVHFNVTKNKTAPPHREGSFKFYFEGKIE
jgi:recombination protein RecA